MRVKKGNNILNGLLQTLKPTKAFGISKPIVTKGIIMIKPNKKKGLIFLTRQWTMVTMINIFLLNIIYIGYGK